MKKFISLLLILMFSFGLVSTVRQEKAEAASIVLGYAVFKAGIAFTGFATYAGWLYANGYTQPVQEMIIGYANKYYDYANGVYTAKVDKVNIIDKMNLYTSALITGNLGNIPTYQELNDIKNDIAEAFPPKIDVTKFNIDMEIDHIDGLFTTLLGDGNFRVFDSTYKDKFIKIVRTNPDYYFYVNTANVGWNQVGSYFFPIVTVISADGITKQLPLSTVKSKITQSMDTANQLVNVLYSGVTTQIITSFKRLNYVPAIDEYINEYGVTPNSYSDTTNDFVFSYPPYYPALNGKATNTQDLENLMNTDEYLQREISRLLEQQQVNEENEVYTPSIGADGMITYPGTETIPENPDIPYNPGNTWYENLFNKVGAIPDLLLGLPDLIGEKIAGVPILGDIVTTGQTIVGKLIDIGESITGFIWGILQQILDAILGLPAKLIELLKDALIWLFVPDATFMQGKIDEFKLNFAFIDTFTDFIKRLEDMTSSNAVPTVSVDLSKFKGSFGGKPISMGAEAYILDMRWYLPFKVMGDLMFTAFVYVMFIWRFFGRLPEIISGGGLLYTADSKTDDLVRKLEGKKK